MSYGVRAPQTPSLRRDDGDGPTAGDLAGLEAEPLPAPVDRMASACVSTVEELPRFLTEARRRKAQEGRPAQLKKSATKKFTRQVEDMWGPDGPRAFGFPGLQNDSRANVPRLLELFDLVDLNRSGDISLDEMQWFLEMQGQVMKR